MQKTEKSMYNYIELAKKYSKAGFSVIPVTSEKIPAIKQWDEFQSRPMSEGECERFFKKSWGIALLCGGLKGVTAIDIDLKYDLSGDIFERFKKKIPSSLLQKLYVQTTKSGGYHLLFSCDKVEPNQKLASRHTTVYEKHQTYIEAFENTDTRDKALKIALNDKSRVLFETRGGTLKEAGGYVVMTPSPGYEHVYGKISHITTEEYDLLMETARMFNEVVEKRRDIRLDKYKNFKLSPFEDYNQRGDVVSLLLESGWQEVGGNSKSVRLKRAGNPKSGSSALFDTTTRVFNCFSTSTIFDVGRGYSPTDVFVILECDGDLSLAFKKLVEDGYGEE